MKKGKWTRTSEFRKKLSLIKKSKVTLEFKQKMHKLMLGNKNGHGNLGNHIQPNNALEIWRKNGGTSWNKGMKGIIHSNKETREKISKKLKGRIVTEETREKIRKAQIGKLISKSTILKLKQYALSHPRSKEFYRENGLACRRMLGLRKPTSLEIKVYKELQNRKIVFEPQKLINNKFLVDAFVPSRNLVIEADGLYWHSLPKTMKKDKSENAYLTKCGYNLLRLTEEEIKNDSFKERL